MDRENPPKIRQRAQLERKQAQRASYDRVLIVSEVERLSRFISRKLRMRKVYNRQTLKFTPAPSELSPSKWCVMQSSCLRQGIHISAFAAEPLRKFLRFLTVIVWFGKMSFENKDMFDSIFK